ncbi:hypothetical protein D8674_041995, partial [Pyrus ussuriensis x Pyrus communis]
HARAPERPPRRSSEFSFLSIRGLLNFLRSAAESDSTINLFSQTQSLLELQAVPILFRHSLKDSDDEIVCNLDHIFGVEPLKIRSPPTDSRVSHALRLFKSWILSLLINLKMLLLLKCGEFLLLLIGHVNGRDTPPLATVHEDIRRLLGEKSASLLWAASQFGSTLDPEQRLTALHIQALLVIESLDLY